MTTEYIPLETGNVSQFALAALSGVAAGHKVNSPDEESAPGNKKATNKNSNFKRQICTFHPTSFDAGTLIADIKEHLVSCTANKMSTYLLGGISVEKSSTSVSARSTAFIPLVQSRLSQKMQFTCVTHLFLKFALDVDIILLSD